MSQPVSSTVDQITQAINNTLDNIKALSQNPNLYSLLSANAITAQRFLDTIKSRLHLPDISLMLYIPETDFNAIKNNFREFLTGLKDALHTENIQVISKEKIGSLGNLNYNGKNIYVVIPQDLNLEEVRT